MTAKAILLAPALLLAATLLLTLIAGRFFCGWACHVVAYQDLCAWLLGRVGLRPRPVRSRVLALVPLGAAAYMFAWPTLERALADVEALLSTPSSATEPTTSTSEAAQISASDARRLARLAEPPTVASERWAAAASAARSRRAKAGRPLTSIQSKTRDLSRRASGLFLSTTPDALITS